MSRDIHALPETRTWREIPQQVRPRAMSSEGRRRVAMGTFRGTMGVFAAALVALTIWEVVSVLHEAPDSASTVAKTDRVRSLVLVTDGVLDKNWLARTLSIPANATLMDLDLIRLRTRVLDDPQVASAAIVRNFPDTLTVRISERSPVVRMMVQSRGEAPTMMLVSRDGVPFSGTGFDPAMVSTLPWIDGVRLERSGGSLVPITGMREVSELLACAKLEAENLYKTWRVVSLAHLATDGEIEVRSSTGMRVTFGTKDDYLRQIARLDLLVDESEDPTRPLRDVNLALGSQVPVTYGSASPTLDEAPAQPAGSPPAKPSIQIPAYSNQHLETHREL